MQSGMESRNMQETNSYNVPPSTVVSQPWWQGVNYGAMPHAVLTENIQKGPSVEVTGGQEGAKGDRSQPDDGTNEGGNASKGSANTETNADGSYEWEHQHMKPVMPEYFMPHTQLELGHSIACPPLPYPDPYYGGISAGFGTQALVHPQFLGMPQNRLVLPLEMTEEPVYVNAKQYHGILRRRQSRAKAELEKKLIKVRKPYLHESRHRHAMRRLRGCGGRFVNTKKADDNGTNSGEKGGGTATAHSMQAVSSLGSGNTPSDSLANLDSCVNKQHPRNPREQGFRQSQTCANGNYHQHSGFQFSAFHSVSSESGEDGDCSGQQRNGLRVNGSSNRVAVTL